jgi:hypothetical protein
VTHSLRRRPPVSRSTSAAARAASDCCTDWSEPARRAGSVPEPQGRDGDAVPPTPATRPWAGSTRAAWAWCGAFATSSSAGASRSR